MTYLYCYQRKAEWFQTCYLCCEGARRMLDLCLFQFPFAIYHCNNMVQCTLEMGLYSFIPFHFEFKSTKKDSSRVDCNQNCMKSGVLLFDQRGEGNLTRTKSISLRAVCKYSQKCISSNSYRHYFFFCHTHVFNLRLSKRTEDVYVSMRGLSVLRFKLIS